MERAFVRPAVAADAAAVTEIVVALESSLYGPSTFSQPDLEEEGPTLDLGRDAVVVDDGRRILGYGSNVRRTRRRSAPASALRWSAR
jgi:hypothetical protein